MKKQVRYRVRERGGKGRERRLDFPNGLNVTNTSIEPKPRTPQYSVGRHAGTSYNEPTCLRTDFV